MITTAAAPRLEGFDHLTLPAHDLGPAEQFYVGLLGATMLRRFDRETFVRHRPERAHEADAENSPLHLAVRFGGAPELHLFLQKGRSKPAPAPHPHLALRVDPSRLDAFTARLRAAGVPVDGPRRLGPPGHASIYFADPSGNLLEIVTTGYEGAVLEGPPDAARLGWLPPPRSRAMIRLGGRPPTRLFLQTKARPCAWATAQTCTPRSRRRATTH